MTRITGSYALIAGAQNPYHIAPECKSNRDDLAFDFTETIVSLLVLYKRWLKFAKTPQGVLTAEPGHLLKVMTKFIGDCSDGNELLARPAQD